VAATASFAAPAPAPAACCLLLLLERPPLATAAAHDRDDALLVEAGRQLAPWFLHRSNVSTDIALSHDIYGRQYADLHGRRAPRGSFHRSLYSRPASSLRPPSQESHRIAFPAAGCWCDEI
jgi:hypothetical protein